MQAASKLAYYPSRVGSNPNVVEWLLFQPRPVSEAAVHAGQPDYPPGPRLADSRAPAMACWTWWCCAASSLLAHGAVGSPGGRRRARHWRSGKPGTRGGSVELYRWKRKRSNRKAIVLRRRPRARLPGCSRAAIVAQRAYDRSTGVPSAQTLVMGCGPSRRLPTYT